MAIPALARFGSDKLKENFLRPTIAGDFVACLGVSEAAAGSDVAGIKTTAKPKKGIINYYTITSMYLRLQIFKWTNICSFLLL